MKLVAAAIVVATKKPQDEQRRLCERRNTILHANAV